MDEPITLADIKHCPYCYHWYNRLIDWVLRRNYYDRTVAITAFEKAKINLGENDFIALNNMIIPITPPDQAIFSQHHIVISSDICCKCGRQYTTRASLIKLLNPTPVNPGIAFGRRFNG